MQFNTDLLRLFNYFCYTFGDTNMKLDIFISTVFKKIYEMTNLTQLQHYHVCSTSI